jgi:hypothetical protein
MDYIYPIREIIIEEHYLPRLKEMKTSFKKVQEVFIYKWIIISSLSVV